jgi:aldehyde:ferredoxin oxidoreductase
MALSDENIEEFQKLYKEHFGVEISKEDARENGIKLLRLISIIYRPKDNARQDELLQK